MAKFTLQVGVQLGYFAQKSRFVVAQCIFNLVGHGQLGKAQQAGLPQLHHTGTQLRLVGGQLAWGQGVFGGQCGADGTCCQGKRFDVVARCEQLRNIAFCVQYAFALHFCRVGCEYGGNKAVGQRVCYGFRCNTGPTQARQGYVNAALLRVTRPLMNGAAANVVPVFGQIGQMAEVSKCANHADGLVA